MLKKLIFGAGVGLTLMGGSTYAHTSQLTLDQTNELYTRMAAANTGVDADGAFGMQCVDIPLDLTENYVGIPVKGNAIDLIDNARDAGYEIVPPTKRPRPGDIFVMATDRLYGHPYGHTGYIWKVNDDGSFETVEQNIGDDSNLYYGTPAQFSHRNPSDDIIGYIRLAYQKK